MDETHIEIAPEEAAQAEVTQIADPLVELQRLREATRWWKKAALTLVLAWLGMFVVSFVQYLGVSMNSDILEEAREEVEKSRRDSEQRLAELDRLQRQAITVSESV